MAGSMLRSPELYLAGLVLLAGCSLTPSTSIQQPMTIKPAAPVSHAAADGAIFHPGFNDRPLFEDVRARNIGDILTIALVETTAASRAGGNGSSYSNSVNANIPTTTTNIPNLLGGGKVSNALTKLFSLSGSTVGNTSNKEADTVSGNANENLTGTITVTVIEVLANGNLLVSGEKRVALNQSDDFIRFSGVVNPATINADTVLSTQVADAHLEYKNSGALSEVINDTQSGGLLGRFFKSVLPF
jgi:flagellar L-ring protein precursor FlgH